MSRTWEPDHPLLLSALLSQDSTYSGLQSQTVTPLPPGRGGAGRARVAAVCGMSVGPRAICHVRLALFPNIEG